MTFAQHLLGDGVCFSVLPEEDESVDKSSSSSLLLGLTRRKLANGSEVTESLDTSFREPGSHFH